MQLLSSTDDSIAGRAAARVAAELATRLHAELATLDLEIADPAPRIVAAARATGCDLVVLGMVAGLRRPVCPPVGWHHRVVRDAPCPVMLVPVNAPLPMRGGVVLAHDVDGLPHQASRAAERLADRLRAPLVITDVVSSRPHSTRRTGSRSLHGAHVMAGDTQRAVAASSDRDLVTPRHLEHPLPHPAAQEAALVVIAGRGSGRTLLPHRHLARRFASGGRLPIVIVPPRAPG